MDVQDSSEEDVFEDDLQSELPEHGQSLIYESAFAEVPLPTQGIKWVILKHQSQQNPPLVIIPDDQRAVNFREAQSMHTYIKSKCGPGNPAVFTDSVFRNWDAWLERQTFIWCNTDLYVQGLDVFQWPISWPNHIHTEEIVCVPSSERAEESAGVQIVLHDSGPHGQFLRSELTAARRNSCLDSNALLHTEVETGKGCIYKWVDEDVDNSEHIWLGVVLSIVEGSPSSPDCKILVRWCPNDKNYTWRNKISEKDTFNLTYTNRLKSSPYRDTIEKKMCIAVNLILTAAGKLDNRTRFKDGSTSKEVAKSAIDDFYDKKL